MDRTRDELKWQDMTTIIGLRHFAHRRILHYVASGQCRTVSSNWQNQSRTRWNGGRAAEVLKR
jgi:hypothetical protein